MLTRAALLMVSVLPAPPSTPTAATSAYLAPGRRRGRGEGVQRGPGRDEATRAAQPARARLFGVLATIGEEYPDLDKTRADDSGQPTGAAQEDDRSQTADSGVGRMRLALEQSIVSITQAMAVLGSESQQSDASRACFSEYCSEAHKAIESALEYLDGL